jgi:hypothetical protein
MLEHPAQMIRDEAQDARRRLNFEPTVAESAHGQEVCDESQNRIHSGP